MKCFSCPAGLLHNVEKNSKSSMNKGGRLKKQVRSAIVLPLYRQRFTTTEMEDEGGPWATITGNLCPCYCIANKEKKITKISGLSKNDQKGKSQLPFFSHPQTMQNIPMAGRSIQLKAAVLCVCFCIVITTMLQSKLTIPTDCCGPQSSKISAGLSKSSWPGLYIFSTLIFCNEDLGCP